MKQPQRCRQEQLFAGNAAARGAAGMFSTRGDAKELEKGEVSFSVTLLH